MDKDDSPVEHEPLASRFVIRTPHGQAECCYRLQGDLLLVTHTEVPALLEGRGLAARVVAATLAWARQQGLKVQPLCSYVAAYMRRHPETRDLRPQD
jgi:predicted GNAT family acetyltransferase